MNTIESKGDIEMVERRETMVLTPDNEQVKRFFKGEISVEECTNDPEQQKTLSLFKAIADVDKAMIAEKRANTRKRNAMKKRL